MPHAADRLLPPGARNVSVSDLVAQYGYGMVLVGALAEGESVLVAAGFAAHRGLLQLPLVMAIAFAASTCSDQFCFYLGRRHGPQLLTRFPKLQGTMQRVETLLRRHPAAAVFGVRFLYGLRTAGPIALGALGVPRWRFALLNMLSAAVWAVGFSLVGYHFGTAVHRWAPGLHAAEEAVLATLLLAAVLLPLAWRLHRRRSAKA